MAPEELVGTWDLVSLFAENSEGEKWYVYGEDPLGMLTYTVDGTMSAVLMKPGRPVFAASIDAPTATELEEAFFGFDAYCGSYTIDLDENKVTHHVLASRLPDWVGSEQVRFFDIAGDTLTIRSAPMKVRGAEWVIYVVWTKHH